MNSPVNESSRRLRFPWRAALALIALALVLWVLHPPILRWGIRFFLTRAGSQAGLQLEVAGIEAHFARSIILEGVRIRAAKAEQSRTAADIARIELSLNWPWRAFLGDGRPIHSLVAEGVRGVIDLRAGDLPPHRQAADPSVEEQRGRAGSTLQWLPEYLELRHGNLEFVAREQSYYFEDISADFSEERLGAFRAAGAELRAGSFNESLGSLEGITAWKDGTLYLASLGLWEGVRIESFVAQLARPGGVALALDATLFGGSLRADVSFGTETGQVAVDSAVWGSHLDVAPLAALFGFRGKAEGSIREARFTFRGIPDRALDGQASLRLAADGFRWNKRGWESLEIGASMIHRRLAVSDFELKQKENVLTGSGEFSLDEGLLGIAKAPFLLNASASIKDLGALAGLFGPPFDEMSGRMSLSGSINGEAGKLGGFVSLEASGMGFRKHPIDSGRVEAAFSNTEAQVTRCEFWSDEDFLRAAGTVQITAPHGYSGEIQARVQDIARYRDLFPAIDVPSSSAGAAQIRWQGDGTALAHSGAFNVSLDDFVSEYTPSGLTGRFAGTYSPQNVYFNALELEKGPLRFSTRATLARSGIKLDEALLRSGGREIAEGELYFPIDPFDVASGNSLGKAWHFDRKLYASIASQEPLSLRDLLRLAGNDRAVDGTVRVNLNAEGFPSTLSLDAKIEGRGLSRKFENGASPPSRFDVKIQGADGMASLAGELASPGLSPVILKVETPFSIVRTADGRLHGMNPDGRFSASLQIPKIDIGVLRPLFPNIQRLEGFLSGDLAVSGTVGRPLLEGQLAIDEGRVEISPKVPVIGNVKGEVSFNAAEATVERFTGEVGEGSFEVRGGASLQDLSNPYYELFLYGDRIQLTRGTGLQLRANANLYASGDKAGGLIKGAVRFVDGRFSRRLEITPLMSVPAAGDKLFEPPQLERSVPPPFNIWKLDVSIANDTPFLFSGNAASGEIIPELELTGTLGNPIPVGQVELKDARVFLPFTTMTIPDGRIDFVEDSPWMPQLNLRGTAQALDYEVQAYAFGPLNERRLILRSEPPLPQDSLIQLLTTGMAPRVYAAPGFGEIPGPGGSTPLRAFGREFDLQGVQADSTVSGLPVGAAPVPFPGGRATLRGRFELWRGLSLMKEGDGLSSDRASFSLRVR